MTVVGSGFCENRSCQGLAFSPLLFLFARNLPFSPPGPELGGFSPPSPKRLSELFNIPCLQYVSVISHLETPGALCTFEEISLP